MKIYKNYILSDGQTSVYIRQVENIYESFRLLYTNNYTAHELLSACLLNMH